MDEHQDGSWFDLDAAATRLGLSRDALRKRITRGKLEVRAGNDGKPRVLVTSSMVAGQEADSLEAVQDESGLIVFLREELAEQRERAAKAEGRLDAMSGRVQDLSAALSVERARADRLEATFAEARKPLLVRLVEALRRQ